MTIKLVDSMCATTSHPNQSASHARLNEQRIQPCASVAADQLFKGAQELLINHNGDTYRLRITKNDKLILTK